MFLKAGKFALIVKKEAVLKTVVVEGNLKQVQLEIFNMSKEVNDMAGRNPIFNSSGCKDLTAYHAITNCIKEEKELDKKRFTT